MTVVTRAMPRAVEQPTPASIDELQKQRADLVGQYVDARPTGSRGWTLGAGIGAGTIGAAAGLGAVLLANRGKGPLYQGLNLMFVAPTAMGAGGAAGYFLGGRLAEIQTRPTGDAAAAQVTASRDQLRQQIAEIDEQLHAADGRRAQPLPKLDDSSSLSLGRVAGHAGAGLGIGVLATGGIVGGVESMLRRPIQGGPSLLAVLAAPALAGGAISYLNQRDEAEGRQGSLLRAAGIGAATVGAATLVPAMKGLPVVPRVLGGAVAGALIGTFVHGVSVSSRD